MKDFNRKEHWDTIYQQKKLTEVSWYQPVPEISLKFLTQLSIPKDAAIIDIGGGDSFFIDHLLKNGFENNTVLDISDFAIKKAQQRLGDKAKNVNWVVNDITQFTSTEKYDFWHDRAAFHFLTDERDVSIYVETVKKHLKSSGFLVLGTFSDKGPLKCSGIEVKQYSEDLIIKILGTSFEKIQCLSVDHQTPFNTLQNFIFCCFRKK